MSTTTAVTPTLEAMIQGATEVATLPTVARRVLELLSQEQSSAAQLQAVIEKDQSLATRVLKIANSAFYGLRREVTSIQRAIVVLGFNTLRSLVLAASAKALNRRFGIAEQLLWDHAVFTSIAGKVVAWSGDGRFIMRSRHAGISNATSSTPSASAIDSTTYTDQ